MYGMYNDLKNFFIYKMGIWLYRTFCRRLHTIHTLHEIALRIVGAAIIETKNDLVLILGKGSFLRVNGQAQSFIKIAV